MTFTERLLGTFFTTRSEMAKHRIHASWLQELYTSAAWIKIESIPQKKYVLQTILSESWKETAIDCQSISLIRGAERARRLIITCCSQVDVPARNRRRCSSDGNLIHAHNKHCNQGRQFSCAKRLMHNSSLKITISVETEEG